MSRRWIGLVFVLSVLLHLLIGWLIVVPLNFVLERPDPVQLEPLALPTPIQIQLLQPPPAQPSQSARTAPTKAPSRPDDPVLTAIPEPTQPQLRLQTEDQPSQPRVEPAPVTPIVDDSESEALTVDEAWLEDFNYDLDAPEPDYPAPIDAWDQDLVEADWLSFADPAAPMTVERVLTEQFARGALPRQMHAIYAGEVIGIDFQLEQRWTLAEDQQYQLVSEAEKFGFKVNANSAGQLTDQGLVPTQFEILINGQRHAFAAFDQPEQVLRYGQQGEQGVALATLAHDLNTVFYQLALLQQRTAARTVQIAAVNEVYQVDLAFVERRPTRLTDGVVLTDVIAATDQAGQFTGEVRFAPSLGNYPVGIRVKYGRFDVRLTLRRFEIDGV
ncbi:MAG: hypothetical protein VXW65_13660 [Pseudomonadota bacterium]|nr:hypothetical protein [Pseudomonadota bacterium]